MRFWLLVLLLICISGCGQNTKEIDAKINETLATDEVLIRDVVRAEQDDRKRPILTTVKDFGDSNDKRNKLVADLKLIKPEIDYPKRHQVIDFLRTEEKLTRMKALLYASSIDIMETSSKGIELAKAGLSYRTVSQSAADKCGEYLSNVAEFKQTYSDAVKQEEEIVKILPTREAVIKGSLDSNFKEFDEQAKSVTGLRESIVHMLSP